MCGSIAKAHLRRPAVRRTSCGQKASGRNLTFAQSTFVWSCFFHLGMPTGTVPVASKKGFPLFYVPAFSGAEREQLLLHFLGFDGFK